MKKISRAQLDKIKASGGKVYRAGDERPPTQKTSYTPKKSLHMTPEEIAYHNNLAELNSLGRYVPKPKPVQKKKEPISPEQALVDLLASMTSAINAFADVQAKPKPDLQLIDGGVADTGPVPKAHAQYAIDTLKTPSGLIDQVFMTDTSGSLAGTKQFKIERNEFGLAERIVGEDKVMKVVRDDAGQLIGIEPE